MQSIPRTVQFIRDGLGATHIGAQLYVSLRGEVIANEAIGMARDDVPMTPATIIVWLSAGKPLTALAVCMLMDQHQVGLDDRVIDYIPEFAPHDKDAVTLGHLLTHTAGMRTIHTDWPRATWDQTIAALCAAKMEKDWPPGEKAGYHAYTTWYLLGEVVRRVTGSAIERFLEERIFSPLGMRDCYLAMTPEQYGAQWPRMANLQRFLDDGRIEPAPFDTEQAASNPRPAGGVRGPIDQLGRFYHAMLRNLSEPGLVSVGMARRMTSRVRSGMFDQTFKANVDWGLGFQINSEQLSPNAPYNFGPYASPAAFGHGGSQSSVGMCDPAHELVVAAVFNGLPGEIRHHQRNRVFFTMLYEELGLG